MNAHHDTHHTQISNWVVFISPNMNLVGYDHNTSPTWTSQQKSAWNPYLFPGFSPMSPLDVLTVIDFFFVGWLRPKWPHRKLGRNSLLLPYLLRSFQSSPRFRIQNFSNWPFLEKNYPWSLTSQKESSFPTIHSQGRALKLRGSIHVWACLWPLFGAFIPSTNPFEKSLSSRSYPPVN